MTVLQAIQLRGARQNNLKSVDVDVPLKQITVITGVSGSGKSSLAFDTIFAEGSRRYMESLSTYARQFLDQIPKPDLDSILGLPPAIALQQRNSVVNSRTTVAKMTEIYDYFRLLYASIGQQVCHTCGHDDVSVNSVDRIAKRILELPEKTKLYILTELGDSLINWEEDVKADDEDDDEEETFLGQKLFRDGFQRILVNNEVLDLSTPEGQTFELQDRTAHLMIDRISVPSKKNTDVSQIVDSLETAFLHGAGALEIRSPDGKINWKASQGYSCTKCGANHAPPTPPLFSPNSPLGACPNCSGFGETLELNEELVVPDTSKTLRNGAIDPLSKPSYVEWQSEMLEVMERRGVSSGTRYGDLTQENNDFLWNGDDNFPGINGYFEDLKQWRYKLHIRVFIRRYQNQVLCPSCLGSRLSRDPLNFFIGEGKQKKNIAELSSCTSTKALDWIQSLKLSENEKNKARELLRQIADRLNFMIAVGVNYLPLNRKGNSLSGGEYQRICLASQLGAKLSQTLYVLDEPSIGLHPADTDQLIQVMKQLRDYGNTVLVVEHDTQIMKAADHLIELGPKAGRLGGELVASAPLKQFLKDRTSLSARYLSGELKLTPPKKRRPFGKATLKLTKCTANNLQSIDVEFPMGLLIAVTGVSGSGKSTLIHDTLYKTLAKIVMQEQIPSHQIGAFEKIYGLKNIYTSSLLDQRPIARSMRSNPATYLKIYDEIRRLMSCQTQAARNGLTPSHFSFNVDGGRCPSCKGEGSVEVDMHFMANIRLICDECKGKRFRKHVLEVTYKQKNIDDILHTTIDEAFELFSEVSAITSRLEILKSVGLSYLQIGQSLNTLSGGECQRLKIASTLNSYSPAALNRSPRLFIFDEPTTGLHLHDTKQLAKLFHKLVDGNHTIIFIEHNMELVAQADWVIDMGPGGGENGGTVVGAGTPEEIARSSSSITGRYLKEILGSAV